MTTGSEDLGNPLGEYEAFVQLFVVNGTKQASSLDDNVSVCKLSWKLPKQNICDGVYNRLSHKMDV